MLDWNEFRARFFPGHRERHDFEALVAYDAYRRSDGGTQPAGEKTPRSSGVAGGHAPTKDDSVVAPSADISNWENEGGTTQS